MSEGLSLEEHRVALENVFLARCRRVLCSQQEQVARGLRDGAAEAGETSPVYEAACAKASAVYEAAMTAEDDAERLVSEQREITCSKDFVWS